MNYRINMIAIGVVLFLSMLSLPAVGQQGHSESDIFPINTTGQNRGWQDSSEFVLYFACDFNGDNQVNIMDLAILSQEWLLAGPGLQADIWPLRGDRRVNIRDFAMLLSFWLMPR